MHNNFISEYFFEEDRSREGRTMLHAKVGDVHISRVSIDANAVVGNLIFHTTSLMCFMEFGRVRLKCIEPKLKLEREIIMEPGNHVVHIPPGVGFAMKNLDNKGSLLVVFSNKPLRSQDDEEVVVIEE